MDFYKYLSECGISCVKTDVQSRIDELSLAREKGPLYPAYQEALLKASEVYLEGRTIYCMSHIPRIIFPYLSSHRPASTARNPPIMRTSDDFYPCNPETHPYHIFSNSMNGFFLSSAYCLQDWDMFQTHDGAYSRLHAFGRAFSGGPVFITDAPGQTDPEVINLLCAPTPRSPALHTVSIDKRSYPVNPYHRFGEESIFCIEASINDGLGKVVGLVNLAKTPVTNLLRAETFLPLTRTPADYRLYSFKDGFLGHKQGSSGLEYFLMTLQPNDWNVITALRFSTEGSRSVTAVGFTDKLLCSAPLKRLKYNWVAQSVTIDAAVDFVGQFKIYTEGFLASEVSVLGGALGTEVPVSYVTVEQTGWITVDLMRFWEENGIWGDQEEIGRWVGDGEELQLTVNISWK